MKKLLSLLLVFMTMLVVILPIYSDGEEDPEPPVHEHDYNTEVDRVEPTCTAKGSYYLKCSCGEKIGPYEINALGHDFRTKINEVPATCTTAGSYDLKCSRCTATEHHTVDELGHKFTEKTQTYKATDADCTHPATYYYTCSICHEKGTETYEYGSALGHKFTEKTDTYKATDADCTHPATYYYTCSVCHEKGTSTYESGKALGHSFTETSIHTSDTLASPATCTSPATYYHTCSVCHAKGTTTYSFGDALGHKFTEKSNKYLKSNATCTSPAVYYFSCATCGAQGTETYEFGSPKGHSFSGWTKVDDEAHTHKCNSCGHSETEAHKWNEGVVKEKPSETKTGLMEYMCTLCGAKKTEVIDIVDINKIPKPNIDIESRHYVYTGEIIIFEVPDSDFYSAKNNAQINAGEYEVEIVLNKDNYTWEDGTKKSIKYKFIIEKADYDMSLVEFKDMAVISDGNSHSLEATNLPDGVKVTYSVSNVSEPGSYEVVASFVGDDNHNEISDMKAMLYILNVTSGVIEGQGGKISGNVPENANFNIKNLIAGDLDYTTAKNAVINDFDIKESNILGVVDISMDYKGLVIEPNGSVTVTMYPSAANGEDFDLYHVHTNASGSTNCEKVEYTLNSDGTITFNLNSFSQLVFVKIAKSKALLIVIILDILAIVGFAIYLIVRKVKNKNNKKVQPKTKKTKKLEDVKIVENLNEEERLAEQAARQAEEERLAKEKEAIEKAKFEAERIAAEQETKQNEVKTVENDVVEQTEDLEETKVFDAYRLSEEVIEDFDLAEEEARLAEEKRLAKELEKKAKVKEEKVEVVKEESSEEKKSFFKRMFGSSNSKKTEKVEKTINKPIEIDDFHKDTESKYKIEDISEDSE